MFRKNRSALFGWLLLGLCISLGLAFWAGFSQYQSLRKSQAALQESWQKQKTTQHFTLWPASFKPIEMNGFEAYWQLIGRPRNQPVSKTQPYSQIPNQDAERILTLFDPRSGKISPHPELTKKYASLLAHWDKIPAYAWIAYPHEDNIEMAMPHLLLIEELSILNSSRELPNCQSGKCPTEKLLQNLVLLRAVAAQGLLIPLMNSYRLERMIFSAWGHQLQASALSPQAWKLFLNQLHAFFWESPPRFSWVLHNQLAFSQNLLFEQLPEKLGEITVETGDENVWADSLPMQIYQVLKLKPQIETAQMLLRPLAETSETYLQAPIHEPKAFQAVQRAMQTAQNLPVLKPVLPPVDFALLRFREQEAWRRGFYLHLALQAWQASHGRYPQKLEELEPFLRTPLPRDPYTGQNLRYQRLAKGYTLYSLGPDQRDQGGGSSYHCFAKTLNCQHEEVRFHPF